MKLRIELATFQALMNSIVWDCIYEFFVVYLDEIHIFSNGREEHLKHLRMVLSRLYEHQLYVSKDKYDLMKMETKFLGLMVVQDGIKIGDGQKRLIKEWPTLEKLTELRSLICLLQDFRRFIEEFSHIATPVTNLTRMHSNIKKQDYKCDAAF